jgi:hypothetical protein
MQLINSIKAGVGIFQGINPRLYVPAEIEKSTLCSINISQFHAHHQTSSTMCVPDQIRYRFVTASLISEHIALYLP